MKEHNHKKERRKTIHHVSLAVFYFGIAMYILLPTAEEIFLHPFFGFFLSNLLGFSFGTGALISMIIYRLIGTIFLCLSLFLGGKIIVKKLKKKSITIQKR